MACTHEALVQTNHGRRMLVLQYVPQKGVANKLDLGQPDSGERVVRCGDGSYCCDNDAPNCCKDSTVRKFDIGDPKIYTRIGEVGGPNSLKQESRLPSSTLGILPAETLKSSSPYSETTSPSNATAVQQQRDNSATLIGVSVGVPLGLLLVAAVAGGIWWMRRMRNDFAEREEAMKADMRAEVYKVSELHSMTSSVHELDPGKHLPARKSQTTAEMP
ncbi:hypothetical protein BU24DRAFT_463358 [Aaosphaeria arxii CBS 175.79]|uniref:Mid2 domain-containing protein n=1 Tax=Aaosphaeria arxii CBS 175.79 TaxID=1450172 RepID=A0A6A5XMX2_9PLEO|nr:uncharacterized protein BU24DRAFT_463358 [Aaosphaeria arxii CBS 175.79]KAF2014578.1 hypothetical protein BU24DRAFT_463358 [Aaosphaeria arxii CBS 175.79]